MDEPPGPEHPPWSDGGAPYLVEPSGNTSRHDGCWLAIRSPIFLNMCALWRGALAL